MNKKELFRFIFWEWIEPIGTALCIALLVMKYVMAIYVIPTGSMQPTLHGKGDYPSEKGDKVLVNKFVYDFTKPKKWDVIVFEYPYNIIQCSKCEVDAERKIPFDQPKIIPESLVCKKEPELHGSHYLRFINKDYIKRCVATPGDELTVRDGNILLKGPNGWVYSEKPPRVQNELWRNVFSLSKESDFENITAYWQWGNSNHGKLDLEKQSMNLKADKNYTLKFYNNEYLLGYGDKGKRGPEVNFTPPLVGDIQFDITLEKCPVKGILEFEILWNLELYRAIIDFDKSKTQILNSNNTLESYEIDKNINRFCFYRLDGQLCYFQNPDNIKKIQLENLNPEQRTTRTLPSMHYKGDAIIFTEIKINRDIYYSLGTSFNSFRGKDFSYKVQPGEYFAMGDNTYYSSDSRNWGTVPEEVLIGKALAVLFPPSRMKLIY